MAEFQVGQMVVLHNVNDRRGGDPNVGTITKIGRTLVTVANKYGHEAKYGMDDQTIRDNYGHSSFKTLDQEAAAAQRSVDIATLADRGFKLDWNARPTDADLHRVAELLRAVPDA